MVCRENDRISNGWRICPWITISPWILVVQASMERFWEQASIATGMEVLGGPDTSRFWIGDTNVVVHPKFLLVMSIYAPQPDRITNRPCNTDLNRYLTLFKVRSDPTCPFCQGEEETVLHYLALSINFEVCTITIALGQVSITFSF